MRFVYFILHITFPLFTTPVTLEILTTVEKCPIGEEGWNKASQVMKCPLSPGFYYHCLRMKNRTLVEGCMFPVTGKLKDGCPWLDVQNGSAKIEFEKCDDGPTNCPPNTAEWFSSKNMYKYPACYTNSISYGQSTPDSTIGTSRSLLDCCSSQSSLSFISKSTIPTQDVHSSELPDIQTTGVSSEKKTDVYTSDAKTSPKDVLLFAVIGGAGVLVTLLVVIVCCLIRVNRRLKRRELSVSNTVRLNDEENNPDSTHYDSIQELQRSESNSPTDKAEVNLKEVTEHEHPYDDALSRSDTVSSSPKSDVEGKKQSEYIPLERATERQVYRSLNSEVNNDVLDYEEPVNNKYEKLLPHSRLDTTNELQGTDYEDLQQDSNNSNTDNEDHIPSNGKTDIEAYEHV